MREDVERVRDAGAGADHGRRGRARREDGAAAPRWRRPGGGRGEEVASLQAGAFVLHP